MADKSKKPSDRDESGRRLSPDEQRARDEATGDLPDGKVMLTNDSGNVKKIDAEEWENEERQAQLLKEGWKEVGGSED